MFRHIAWFNEAAIEPDPKGGLRSNDARVSRRCLQPACTLEEKHGINCSVFGNLHDAEPNDVNKLLQKLETEVVVIGAFADPSLLKLARSAKHLGCYVVADFADQTTISTEFEKLAAIADQVIAATPEAAACLQAQNIESALIPDVDEHTSAEDIAKLWMSCFKALKMKPPVCANSNTPPVVNG